MNLPGSANEPIARSNGADTRPIFYTFSGTPTNGVVTSDGQQPHLRQRATRPGWQYGGSPEYHRCHSDEEYQQRLFLRRHRSAAEILQQRSATPALPTPTPTARSVNDGGSIAQSIWRDRQVSGDPNANVLSYSNFLQQHRVIALGLVPPGVPEPLGHHHLACSTKAHRPAATRYVYSGDMNGDGQTSNDLMYVPRNQSEIILRDITLTAAQGGGTYSAAQQWADLDAFINQDNYLSKRRGEYAERNGAVAPWQHRVDVRTAAGHLHQHRRATATPCS